MLPPQMDLEKSGLYLKVQVVPCSGAQSEPGWGLDSGSHQCGTMNGGRTAQKLIAADR